jgi:death-on-curing family protein
MLCGCTEVSLFGSFQYETLPKKAAKLFYSTIKTHPFPNGNKRFAFVAVLWLLIANSAMDLPRFSGQFSVWTQAAFFS